MTAHSRPKELPLTEARSNLSEISNEVAFGHKRIILTRKGKRLIALVPLEDLEALEAIEERIDLDDARKALADVKKKGSVSWNEIKRKLDL
jgi:prevent-host-death family protein